MDVIDKELIAPSVEPISEKAHRVARAALSAVPILGGVLVEGLNAFIEQPMVQRRTEWMIQITNQINVIHELIEKTKNIENITNKNYDKIIDDKTMEMLDDIYVVISGTIKNWNEHKLLTEHNRFAIETLICSLKNYVELNANTSEPVVNLINKLIGNLISLQKITSTDDIKRKLTNVFIKSHFYDIADTVKNTSQDCSINIANELNKLPEIFNFIFKVTQIPNTGDYNPLYDKILSSCNMIKVRAKAIYAYCDMVEHIDVVKSNIDNLMKLHSIPFQASYNTEDLDFIHKVLNSNVEWIIRKLHSNRS